MRMVIGFVMFLSLLSACRKAEMESYPVPKEDESHSHHTETMDMGGETSLPENHPPLDSPSLPEGHPPVMGDLPPGHPEIASGAMTMENAAAQGLTPPPPPSGNVTWVAPAGWKEKPGSGFRYATFVVPGGGGSTGDLSVTVLSGDAGGLLSNVNRWRGQIGLPGLTDAQLIDASKKVSSSGTSFTVVNFVSEDRLLNGKDKKRLLAAVGVSQGQTWFFKLIGADDLVQSAEPTFVQFLKSVKGL